MIDWLNANQGFAITLLTLIYVVSNLVVVVIMLRANALTARSIETTVALERDRTRPSVLFHLFTGDNGFVKAMVRNIGSATAFDVRINLTPEIESAFHKGGTIGFLARPLVSLPPGAEHSTLVNSYLELEKQYPDLRYSGSITYRDLTGKEYDEPFNIDIAILRDLTHFARKDIDDVAKLLEKIERTLNHLANGFYKPVIRVVEEGEYQKNQKKAALKARRQFEALKRRQEEARKRVEQEETNAGSSDDTSPKPTDYD